MEKILKLAIAGGYPARGYETSKELKMLQAWYYVIVCDHSFWQALAKACGWGAGFNLEAMSKGGSSHTSYGTGEWKVKALHFHEINLTEGWDAAVAFLSDLTTK